MIDHEPPVKGADMKYFHKRSRQDLVELGENDPLSGIANLFDLGLILMLGVLVTFLGAFKLLDLFDPKSQTTIMKKSRDGQLEIISKEGKKIKAMRVSKTKMQGQGERLGVAYRLEDGTMVYVPDRP